MGKKNRSNFIEEKSFEGSKQIKQIKKQKKKNSKQKLEQNDDQIDEFLSEIDTRSISHDEFLKIIRSKCNKIAKEQKDGGTEIFVKEYYLEKFCEVCKHFNDDDKMLLCDFCEDSYHTYCLSPPLLKLPLEEEDWMCSFCEKEKNISDQNKEKRQSMLEEHFSQTKTSKEKQCKQCCLKIKKPVLTNKKKNSFSIEFEEYEICMRCRSTYHKQCFNNKKTSIICKECENQIISEIPKNQKNILDYFKIISKINQDSDDEILDLDYDENQLEKTKKQNIRLKSQSPTKKIKQAQAKKHFSDKKSNNKQSKNAIFNLPVPITDPEKLLEQKKSMIFALKAKNIQFDDDLRFSNPNCPPESNNTNLEPNLQKMSNENYKLFKKFKQMTREGNYPPVIIEEDKQQGFIVRAIESIPQLTLICEYVGEVDFLRNRVFDQNDSIMELLKTARSQTTLVICPEKYGNLARFISGINNTQKSSKQKQNVQSIRMSVDNHSRVFLYAKKNIKKGDILYYDYNAGGFAEYPTHYFV